MLPGECLCSGASDKCPDCGAKLVLQVLRSNAGWYIGTACCCGPYTRESMYYARRGEATKALTEGGWVDRSGCVR